MSRAGVGLVLLTLLALAEAPASAQQSQRRYRPEDTEVWEPVPPVVKPGPETTDAAPPSDAVVLFGGSDEGEWLNARDGAPAGWTLTGGVLTVDKAVGDIYTRRRFRDFQLHIEWRVPVRVTGSGQERGNSGVFLAWDPESGYGYELQVLDSYENATYVNGMAGSIYKQAIPLANPTRPPGQWQSYDVVWRGPRFDEGGSLESPARVTVLFNGVLVEDDFELKGHTPYIGLPEYHAHGRLPIMLQAHGDPSPPLSFRNIWIREIHGGERDAG